MKTFKEYVSEDAPVLANGVGDGSGVAGVADEPIKKKGCLLITRNKNNSKKRKNDVT